MLLTLDHIAILTTSLEQCAKQLPPAFTLYKVEEQPAEGTREQYAATGIDGQPMLLMLEPIAPGPYQRAMDKRGPGLHHLGCVTDSLDQGIAHFASRGLLLHPVSVKTYPRGVVWMCRPRVPFLIELAQTSAASDGAQTDVVISLPRQPTASSATSDFIPDVSIVFNDSSHLIIEIPDLNFTLNPTG